MHILVAALLALSCFIPAFGSLSSTPAGPISDGIQNEQTMPGLNDRDGDSTFNGDRIRPDRSDVNKNDQNDQNGNADQNDSDTQGQPNDPNASDESTQNGDRPGGKRFNQTPDDQSGTTLPDRGTAPDNSSTPENSDVTQNNSMPTV